MMERPIQKGGRRGRSSYEERGKVKNGSKKKIRGRKKGGGRHMEDSGVANGMVVT